MKKRILTLTAVLAIAVFAFGQSPGLPDHSRITDSSAHYAIVGQDSSITFYPLPPQAFSDTAGAHRPLVIITGHDTVTIRDTLNIPTVGPIVPSDHIGPIPIPSWLQIALIVLATIVFTVLPAIQAVLKVIPTPWSIRIGGWIGKILDWATWFIKDTSTTVGVFHK